jgi:membrane associated rhomboid family serine protease
MRYNSPNSPIDNLRDFAMRGGAPVTMALLAANIITFLGAFFSPYTVGAFLKNEMVFDLTNFFHAPWTLVTFPLVSTPPFTLMLVVTWVFFWLCGSSLERSWSSQRFAVFFFALTLFTSLSFLLGGLLLRRDILPLNDLFLPLTGLIVAFCLLNMEQQITVYFFPVRAKYVALGVTLLTYFSYGSLLGPVLGLFSLGGILAAVLYVKFGRSWADIGSYSAPRRNMRGPDLRMDSRPARPAFRTTLDGSPTKRGFFDAAGRWKDWQERRRLEKLWKNSGFSGSESEWRDDEKRRK